MSAIRQKNFQNIIPNDNKFVCSLHFPANTPSDQIHKIIPSIFFRKRLLNGDEIRQSDPPKNTAPTNGMESTSSPLPVKIPKIAADLM